MQKSKEDRQKERDDFLLQFAPPSGNIWGWKFSLFGLGIILFFTLWIAWLHYVKSVPAGFKEQKLEINPLGLPEKTDTTNHE